MLFFPLAKYLFHSCYFEVFYIHTPHVFIALNILLKQLKFNFQDDGEENFMLAFDNMLEAWTSIIQEFTESSELILFKSATSIFDTYLYTHLSKPEGIRNDSLETAEEIEDNEDNDRIKYKEQLQTIGTFGRIVPQHCLSLLHTLLEDRTDKLRNRLTHMQTQAMTVNDSVFLDNLFEDIHWIILVAGHTLCMESDGETPLIPTEIMQYSMKRCTKDGKSDLDSTLKVMANVQQHGVRLECENMCDDVIRIFCDVLKISSVEILAAEVKLGHFMSPEVTCSVMWFLKRFCLAYLLPNEVLYQEVSYLFRLLFLNY